MTKLEDLTPQTSVRGILPDALVTVVSAQWFGSESLELTYKNPAGKVANELLYRHDEPRLDVVEHGRPWSFDGADEVISHLAGLVVARVKVTLEIEAEIPAGTPDNVVRTVTENSRTLQVHEPGIRDRLTPLQVQP